MATVPPKKNVPAKEYESVYNVSKLNLIFTLSAILILVVSLWMVADDYTREWKQVQREFNRREVEALEQQLVDAQAQIDPSELETLKTRERQAQTLLAERNSDLKVARSELNRLEGEWYRVDQDYRFTKAIFDVKKFEYEEALDHGASKATKLGEEVETLRVRLLDLGDATRDATAARDAAQAAIDALTAERDEVEADYKKLHAATSKLEKQIVEIGPNFKNTFRNAPVVDFLNPSIKIKQVVVDDLKFDVNFDEIPRTDRCQTCHVKIDEPGYEDWPQPYTTHPDLDKFLSSSSSHPIDTFGCTVCHHGRGWGTTFQQTAHTPATEDQAHDWHEKYGWHPMHHWEQPMLRLPDTEASCFKCHMKEIHLPGADRLNKARTMFFQGGCYGCHKVEGYEGMRRSGPSLERISVKTNPDWAYLWIMDPPAFRPSRMPKFFGLSNTSSPEFLDRNRVEVASIVEYLFDKSTNDISYTDSGRGGDASRGEELVGSIGCKGCHAVGNEGVSWGDPRFHGPNLMGTGSKVRREWLLEWVKNPRHYWSETRMPDMRLSDREARDITAYLMTLERDGVDGFERPSIDRDILKTIAMEYLTQRATRRQAEEQWQAMAAHDQVLYVGEKQIDRYGCFGCHDIAGFEDAQPIGTELSAHGDKPLFQLDFGFVDIPHERRDFFVNKMKNPRIYDLGRVKTPQDKLRMPKFSFTEEEAELMAMNLLGFKKQKVTLARRPPPTVHQQRREGGWWIAHERNCIACHSFDGYGGAIKSTIEDPAMHPPVMKKQGTKVHPDWLFAFLKEPAPIRPWLEVRMPTFGLTDHQATNIVKFFSALDDEALEFRTDAGVPSATLRAQGSSLFEEYKCQSCHVLGDQFPPGKAPSDWAPDLSLAADRLQPRWIDEWLKDPQALQPGTKMPGFFYYYDEDEGYQELYPDAGEDIEKIRAHVLTLGRRN